MRVHRTAAVATAALLAVATSGLAVAQESVPVTTELGVGTRVLEVTDLAGSDLTGLALTPGRASAFRVAVRDTSALTVDPNFALEGYDVESSLTNLYASTGASTYDFTDSIPSGEVTLGSATSPLDVQDMLAQLDPDYLLDTTTAITCDAIAAELGLNVVDILTTPTCTLLATLTGSALTFTDVPLAGSVLTDIDLASLAAAQLPLVPTGGQDAGSKYTAPDCLNGIGALDVAGCTSASSGTELTMLSATPATSITTQLDALLAGAVPVTLASLDGSGAKASLQDVLDALANSGISDVSSFATRLASDFTQAQQLEVVNSLMAATLAPLGLDDIVGYGALAAGFPTLRVDPLTATDGVYAGTLTVRLVECPECP